MVLQDRKYIKGETFDGYFVTVDEISKLVRQFQADNHDGFVSNDEAYVEKRLNDRKFIKCGLPNGKLYYIESPKYIKNNTTEK